MSSHVGDFSQEHCELEHSHTGQNSEESTRMRKQELWAADGGDRLCQQYQSMNTNNFFFLFYFCCCWPYWTLTEKWRESFLLAKYLSSFENENRILPKKKKKKRFVSPSSQIQTVFSRSNKRRGLTDTINIAHVFYKDVFAYKCLLSFLCIVIFPQVTLYEIHFS